MARRLSRADRERIAKEVHDHVGDGTKVRKLMRCGHEDRVFANVDEKTSDCWVCLSNQQMLRTDDKAQPGSI
jgi:hypothetical protein